MLASNYSSTAACRVTFRFNSYLNMLESSTWVSTKEWGRLHDDSMLRCAPIHLVTTRESNWCTGQRTAVTYPYAHFCVRSACVRVRRTTQSARTPGKTNKNKHRGRRGKWLLNRETGEIDGATLLRTFENLLLWLGRLIKQNKRRTQ